MRARLAISLLALLGGTALADRWIAPRLVSAHLPELPFGELNDPDLVERLELRRSRLQRSSQAGRLLKAKIVNGFDPDLGWNNHEGWMQRGKHLIHVGPKGTRGRVLYPLPKPKGSARVLCMGDSFVWGSEVGDKQTWPYLLEQESDIEAPNLAVGGYGLDQTLLRLRKEGAALRPDVVIFGCMLASAGRHGNRIPGRLMPRDAGPQVKPRFLLQDGALKLVPIPYQDELSLLDAALSGRTLAELLDHEVWLDPSPWPPFSYVATHRAVQDALHTRKSASIWKDLDSECMQLTFALIEALHAEARALGAKRSLFLLFPNRAGLLHASRGVERFWAPALAQLPGSYLDLTDALLEALPPVSEQVPQWRRTDKLFANVHLSPQGNRVVAQAVLAWLRED